MGWTWVLAGLGMFLATLTVGLWAGWSARGEHDERAAQGRHAAGTPADATSGQDRPLSPFPGQVLLEIEEPDEENTGGWYRPLLERNGVYLP